MLVQISTLRGLDAPENFTDHVQDTLESSLGRFDYQITRVEAHFGEKQAKNSSPVDKRCSLEARLAGHQPMAAVCEAKTVQAAFDGAVDKLVAVIDHTLGRLRPSH